MLDQVKRLPFHRDFESLGSSEVSAAGLLTSMPVEPGCLGDMFVFVPELVRDHFEAGLPVVDFAKVCCMKPALEALGTVAPVVEVFGPRENPEDKDSPLGVLRGSVGNGILGERAHLDLNGHWLAVDVGKNV